MRLNDLGRAAVNLNRSNRLLIWYNSFLPSRRFSTNSEKGTGEHRVFYSVPKLAYTPCRLLYLVGQLRLGGLERQLYYLLASLDRSTYHPAVVVWNLNRDEKYYREIEALGIPICGFPAERSALHKLRAFRILAQQMSPEVIHSYSFHTNFAAYYAARRIGVLAIGSLRSDFVWTKRQGGIIKGALNARWPYSHISNSRTSAKATDGHCGLFVPRQVFVVRNGLDLNRFHCPNEPPTLKSYVAAVGTLSLVKRWDRLLRVIQRLRTVGTGDAEFRIAGDGPLRLTLERMARDLGISSRARFLGENHDIPKFLSGAKFLVHTSETEGCPNVVMEAMACGLPVVAMEAGDISCLIEEGKTGFVVHQGDEGALARRITQLLSDDSLCKRMGVAGRAKAEREFGLQRLVSETLQAYRDGGWKDAINRSCHDLHIERC
jgi:glycosyltransferase involved in cell wall biosynthesis